MLELERTAQALGLAVLAESTTQPSSNAPSRLRTPLLGINNRNLRTFETSLETTLSLLPRVPAGRLVITESGILAAADVARMRANGVDAFLVGEAFMRAADPGAALATLFVTTARSRAMSAAAPNRRYRARRCARASGSREAARRRGRIPDGARFPARPCRGALVGWRLRPPARRSRRRDGSAYSRCRLGSTGTSGLARARRSTCCCSAVCRGARGRRTVAQAEARLGRRARAARRDRDSRRRRPGGAPTGTTRPQDATGARGRSRALRLRVCRERPARGRRSRFPPGARARARGRVGDRATRERACAIRVASAKPSRSTARPSSGRRKLRNSWSSLAMLTSRRGGWTTRNRPTATPSGGDAISKRAGRTSSS